MQPFILSRLCFVGCCLCYAHACCNKLFFFWSQQKNFNGASFKLTVPRIMGFWWYKLEFSECLGLFWVEYLMNLMPNVLEIIRISSWLADENYLAGICIIIGKCLADIYMINENCSAYICINIENQDWRKSILSSSEIK